MGSMRTITQYAEVRDLAPESIIVDGTDTPMQVLATGELMLLAGPASRSFRRLGDKSAVVLPATVRWEPVS